MLSLVVPKVSWPYQV